MTIDRLADLISALFIILSIEMGLLAIVTLLALDRLIRKIEEMK